MGRLLPWLPALLLGLAVVVLAHLPPRLAVPSDLGTGLGDQAGHGAALALLALAFLAVPELGRRRLAWLLVPGGLALFAAVLEGTQLFAGRAAQAGDWAAGTAGAVLAALGWAAGRRLRGPRIAASPAGAYTGGGEGGNDERGEPEMTGASGFEPVARVAEIPDGRGLRIQRQGRRLVLFQIEGEFHAFEDFCPEGADLSRGVVSDQGDVLCPHHGWRFDVREGVCSMVPDRRVRKFPVKVAEGRVWVDLS